MLSDKMKQGEEAGRFIDLVGWGELYDTDPGLRTTNAIAGSALIGYSPLYFEFPHTVTDGEFGSPKNDLTELSVKRDGNVTSILQEDGVWNTHNWWADSNYTGIYINCKNTSYDYTMWVAGTIIVREDDANGRIIYRCDFSLDMPYCYLTTCMVEYYGKEDDGIELTAMRLLREKYKEKHKDTLKKYYSDSRKIIKAIKDLDKEEFYYNYIKSVVDEIVILVNDEKWEDAEQAYLNLYYKLKEELIQ